MRLYRFISISVLLLLISCSKQKETPLKYTNFVNPFIGTSNFGATNPGAIAPRGMVSVSPFNVSGTQNALEKDSRWLSNPYVYENTFLTGFSHVNLSGVGCPDLGVILTMPTTGALQTDHLQYGSTYAKEVANPGYYSTTLKKYDIKVETTATTRTGISRYFFPKGKSNILLNLGLGLTNEQGATVKIVSPTEIEGVRNVGSFCYYKPEESYPVYFVAKFSKPSKEFGLWKNTPKYKGTEGQWMPYNGEKRLYKNYKKEIIGDKGKLLTENLEVSISFYNENPISIDLPNQVTCKIETTDVALKGQTVSSSYKPATLENGLNIQVPPFIESGDEIIVDTRTLEYIKKV